MLRKVLFVVYIVIGVIVAAGHHYFAHLDAVKPIISAVLAGVVVATRPLRGQPASQVDSGPGKRSRTPFLGRPLVNHGSRPRCTVGPWVSPSRRPARSAAKAHLSRSTSGISSPRAVRCKRSRAATRSKASGSGPPTPMSWTWSAASRRRP
jgi:hypothetical protein